MKEIDLTAEQYEVRDIVNRFEARRKAMKATKTTRLVHGSLAKNCCKDRSGDGRICGDVYVSVTKKSGRITDIRCLTNGHIRTRKAIGLPVRKVN